MKVSNKTKVSLFIDMSLLDSNNIGREVFVSEFIGKYSCLALGNGFGWGRSDSSFGQKYIIELTRGKFNAIVSIKISGLKKQVTYLSQGINKIIWNIKKKEPCAITGRISTLNEVDHKDGRKNNPRVMNIQTQVETDFQSLSKEMNNMKRQACKECEKTGLRFDAKRIGFTSSVIIGNIVYDENINEECGCVGCYYYDPVEFRGAFSITKFVF